MKTIEQLKIGDRLELENFDFQLESGYYLVITHLSRRLIDGEYQIELLGLQIVKEKE